jgi:hypothetical protein
VEREEKRKEERKEKSKWIGPHDLWGLGFFTFS